MEEARQVEKVKKVVLDKYPGGLDSASGAGLWQGMSTLVAESPHRRSKYLRGISLTIAKVGVVDHPDHY